MTNPQRRLRRRKGKQKTMADKKKNKDTYRYVTVPEGVAKTVGEGERAKDYDLSFHKFLELMLDDQKFTKNGKGLRIATRLEAAFADADVGEVVRLHPDDWELLKDVVEAPTGGYPNLQGFDDVGRPFSVAFSRLCLPLVDAITDAATSDPREAEKDDEAESAAAEPKEKAD